MENNYFKTNENRIMSNIFDSQHSFTIGYFEILKSDNCYWVNHKNILPNNSLFEIFIL